jgi:hypothetical protein
MSRSPTTGVWRAAPTVAAVVDTPDRKLAEAVRTNPRVAPLVGHVLELLQPYTEAHPKVVVRHVEELDSVTLPDGTRHQHGFVAITTVGLVVVWRSGVVRKRRGEHELQRRDTTAWELDDDGLLVETAGGSTALVWRRGSKELDGFVEAFHRHLPLGR